MRALKMYLNILAESFKMRVKTGQWISILLMAVIFTACGFESPRVEELRNEFNKKFSNVITNPNVTEEDLDECNRISDAFYSTSDTTLMRQCVMEIEYYLNK